MAVVVVDIVLDIGDHNAVSICFSVLAEDVRLIENNSNISGVPDTKWKDVVPDLVLLHGVVEILQALDQPREQSVTRHFWHHWVRFCRVIALVRCLVLNYGCLVCRRWSGHGGCRCVAALVATPVVLIGATRSL